MTMFTDSAARDLSLRSLINYDSENLSVFTNSQFDDNRYSRYHNLGTMIPFDNEDTAKSLFIQGIYSLPEARNANLPNLYQWKTFHDSGRKTCCGGGFVRKFADGTTDWKKEDVLISTPETLPA